MMAKGITVSEKQLEAQVKHLAALFGFLYYHSWSSFHSAKGFPDCVLVKDDRLIFAELKTGTGKTTINQEVWLLALRQAGQEVYLWRPDDFDQIKDILQRPREATEAKVEVTK